MPGKKQPAGSPTAGEPAFLEAGKIRRPHGVRGEVLVEIYTDFPERLSPKRMVFVGAKHVPLTIRSQRSHGQGLLLAFDGFDTPEAVGRFRNQLLYITAAEASELEEGEYYYHQLLDLDVIDDTGRPLGRLTEIMETGANDVYVVTSASGTEILLPAIPEVVLDVDLSQKTMRVHLLQGLIPSESEEA